MTILYVRSTDGNNSDSGLTWALAKATLVGAYAAAAAGDTIYVSQVHSESNAANVDSVSPGTIASPVKVICANDGAEPPTAVATTAVIATTSGNYFSFNSGATYFYGIEFSSGHELYLGWDNGDWWFDTCKFTLTNAVTFSIILGAGDYHHVNVILKNCTYKFSDTSQAFQPRIGRTSIIGGSIDGAGSVPTNLFRGSGWQGLIDVNGFDASLLGSNTLVADIGTGAAVNLLLQGIKLGSSAVITATQSADHNIDIIDCDSGATNYRHERYQKAGSQVVETTIVRTGGATDGTTPISWKIVTTASASWAHPFSSMPMAIWNDTVGSVTATVYAYIDQAGLPKNDDVWCEFHYMGSAGSPIATIDRSDSKASFLATNADQDSDSSTWGGGDTTTRFKMNATFTTGQKGPIYAIIKAGKASATLYGDPKIVLT